MVQINIDPRAQSALHDQIAAALREQIAQGGFAIGESLPPATELAQTLGVNRNTVLRAYRQLDQESVVALRRSRGAVVLPQQDLSDVLARIDELLDAAGSANLTVGGLVGLISRRAHARD